MATAQTKKYDFDRVVRMVMTLLVVATGIFLINYLSPVLLPFLVGFILAYVLDPIVRFVQRVTHIRRRGIAVVLTLLLVTGLLTLSLWLIIPYIAAEIVSMTKMLAAYAKASFTVPYIPDAVQEYIRQYLDVEQFASLLSKEQWFKVVNGVANGTWSFVGGTLSALLSFASSLIVLLYMIFVLLDFDKLSRAFKSAVPKPYRRMSFRVLNDVENTMSRYFRGQALVSLCVGIIFAIEFYIIGLPMAIVFGLSVGVLNMVPYLQLISIPVAAFLCLVASVATGTSFWALAGWTFVAYCVCQLIQDLIITPAVMKQQMGLNPAIIFLALSLWAYVLGFTGLIIGLPLTTLIISYYCEYVLHEPNPLHRRVKPKKKPVNIAKALSAKRDDRQSMQ